MGEASLEAIAFSSGNPRVEETRGVMLLFPDDVPSFLPVGRNPLVCVLRVPNHKTYADFCQFCGFSISQMLHMRIMRKEGVEDQYIVLIKFADRESADSFYKHNNRRRFSTIEDEVCHVRYVFDVQYRESVEQAPNALASIAEQPNCPVCLERLDQDIGGTLTTICNHTFHCSCISKWTDSSCPVCRYCQELPEMSTCSICGSSGDMWMCLICGFVGCGRDEAGHAVQHWKETQHCYSYEVRTQRAWDYAGNNYVHRLIQSKTDGKLVELNLQSHSNVNGVEEAEIREALWNSKVDAIIDEYNGLLKSQLENQREYYESRLLEVRQENERKIAEAAAKSSNPKLRKSREKLQKLVEEKKFLEELNANIRKNQDILKEQFLQIRAREQAAAREKDEKIQMLQQQLTGLLLSLESPGTADKDVTATLSDPQEPPPATSSNKSSTRSSSNMKKNSR